MPVLTDMGSSVPSIFQQFFNSHKDQHKYQYCSCSVKISTLNFDVKFIGCVKASFRINNAHHCHPLFIFEFGVESAFDGLFGFDFIRKYNLVIIPNIECCKINNEYIPFVNRKFKFKLIATDCNFITEKETRNHLPSTKRVDFSQFLKNFH